MWELDHKEGWAPKNWCFWIVVLEKILRVPWTARRSNQSNLKEITHEYSLEELMLKWKLNDFGAKSRSIWNDPAAGKDWRKEEKGATEDEMVGWHDWLSARRFQQTRRQWRTGKAEVMLFTGLQKDETERLKSKKPRGCLTLAWTQILVTFPCMPLVYWTVCRVMF